MTYIIIGWGPVSKTVPLVGHVVTQKEKQLLRQESPETKPKHITVMPEDLVKVLVNQLGCRIKRQTGSHMIVERPEKGKSSAIPIHCKEIAPKTLDIIMKQLEFRFNEEVRPYLEKG